MASIFYEHTDAGATLVAMFRRIDNGKRWNGTDEVLDSTIATADVAVGTVSATNLQTADSDDTTHYETVIPGGLSAGYYQVFYYNGPYTLGKVHVGRDSIYWDGTNVVRWSRDGDVATAAKLLAYFQLLARSDPAIANDNSTELTELNADGGSGGGDYSNQTEAQEAIRDNGDEEWGTASGFATAGALTDHDTDIKARTLPTADYFDPTSDDVAQVTLVVTTTDVTNPVTHNASERNSMADAILVRAVANVEGSADRHSLGAVVMLITNSSITGTTWTAKKPSDDSTFDTYTVVVDAGAEPITGVS